MILIKKLRISSLIQDEPETYVSAVCLTCLHNERFLTNYMRSLTFDNIHKDFLQFLSVLANDNFFAHNIPHWCIWNMKTNFNNNLLKREWLIWLFYSSNTSSSILFLLIPYKSPSICDVRKYAQTFPPPFIIPIKWWIVGKIYLIVVNRFCKLSF